MLNALNCWIKIIVPIFISLPFISNFIIKKYYPKINGKRIGCAIAYLEIFIFIIYLIHNNLFCLQAKGGFDDDYRFFRFLWCVAFSCLGFAAIAFYWRETKKSPFPDYLVSYPLLLLSTSAIVFSVLHLYKETSGYLFYYMSAAICIILGYWVDTLIILIQYIPSRIGEWIKSKLLG